MSYTSMQISDRGLLKQALSDLPDMILLYTAPNIYFWIGIAVGLAGLLLGIGTIYFSWKAKKIYKKTIDWADIQLGCRDLKKNIIKDQTPEVFLSLDARSAIIAYLVEELMPSSIPLHTGFCFNNQFSAQDLNFKDHFKIRTAHWSYFLPYCIENFKNKNIIVFDDFTISGKTFDEVKAALVLLGWKKENIKTAAIACTETSRITGEAPDYYWKEIPHVEAILPWGRMT